MLKSLKTRLHKPPLISRAPGRCLFLASYIIGRMGLSKHRVGRQETSVT